MDETLFHGSLVTTNRILYTPTSFAKSCLIHVQEVGELQATKIHTSKRGNLASYLFFIVLSGSGSLEYGGIKYELSYKDCIFIDCIKPYSHSTSNNLWKLQWVHFYGPPMSNIYEKYIERGGVPVFQSAKIMQFSTVLNDLYQMASSEDYVKDMLINEKLATLLTLIMKESWHPDYIRRSSPKKQNIQAIKDYLDSSYKQKITLNDLSERFFINKFYLTRIFKVQYGMSINDYLLQNRITHAKQLLRFTDFTLAMISFECGMGDDAFFSRMFKQIEGVSPGTFRKLWTEQF
jgi:AraC family transcriptional regulator, arabinose operon regulatory protein